MDLQSNTVSPALDTSPGRMGKYVAVLVCAYLVLGCWNLQRQTIASPDEPRYACAARQMIRSGDWIVPYFNAEPRLVKPIMIYWELAALGTLAQSTGMPMELAFRFGPLLMGMAAMLATFLLGTRMRGPRFGFIAAVILMTTFEYHKLSRELVCDMTLTAFLIGSWLCFVYAMERLEAGISASAPLLGFYLCLGLACMTKGPFVVAVFVVVPLVVYLWWTGRLSLLPRAGIFWGAPLALAIGMWWSFAISQRHLDAGSFYSKENISRFLGTKDHQSPWPFVFYLATLCGDFAPWVLLIPVAGWWSYTQFKTQSAATSTPLRSRFNSLSDSAKLLTCCLAIPFFFVGVSVSKRPLYLLPLYPYLAMWVAWLIDAAFLTQEGSSFCKRCANVLGAGVAVLFVGLAVAMHWAPQLAPKIAPKLKFQIESNEMWLASIILAGLALVAFSASQNLKIGQRYNAVLQVLAMAVAIIIGYEAIVTPIRERDADRIPFFAAVQDRVKDRPFVMFEDSPNEAVWYLDRKTKIDDLTRPELKAQFFDKPGALMLALVQDGPKTRVDPTLLSSMRVLGAPIQRGAKQYLLTEPDPAHPPDPAVFVGRKPSHSTEAVEPGDE